MRSTSRRLVAVALLAASAALPVALAPEALAATQPQTIGGLTIEPKTGVSTASITVTTSVPCPQGTNLQGKIYGKGFPAGGQNTVPNSKIEIYPKAPGGGYRIALQDTIDDFLRLQPGRPQLSGTYTLTIECRNAFGAPFSQFVGTVAFSSPTSFTAQPPKTYPAPPAPTAQPSAGSTPGATAGAGGQPGAQPSASGFPNAPNAAPGAPTTKVDDSFSVGGVAGIPLPLIVVGLIALIGGVSWWNHRRAPSGPAPARTSAPARQPADIEEAAAAEAATRDEDGDDSDESDADADTTGPDGDEAWPSLPMKR